MHVLLILESICATVAVENAMLMLVGIASARDVKFLSVIGAATIVI